MEKIIYNESFKDRIDSYLSSYFSYSRNFFHHIIERWWVLVNWKKIKKSYKLKQWDEIQIDNLERYLDNSFLEELPFVDIPIILEKEDYLVINKPKWVLSHPNSIWDMSAPSVVAFLYQKYKNLPSIWNFIRAGIIHRLDKDTDGLMIIVKTEKWLKYFKELFNKKSIYWEKFAKWEITEKELNKIPIKKYYKAKVNITKKWEEFLNNISLPYFIKEVVKPKVPYPWKYKIWITKIKEILEDLPEDHQKITKWKIASHPEVISKCKSPNISKNHLIYLQIITWRTHQIRYHLSQKWLAIIWDKLYWNKEEVPMKLTAYKLEFTDCNWEKIHLEI